MLIYVGTDMPDAALTDMWTLCKQQWDGQETLGRWRCHRHRLRRTSGVAAGIRGLLAAALGNRHTDLLLTTSTVTLILPVPENTVAPHEPPLRDNFSGILSYLYLLEHFQQIIPPSKVCNMQVGVFKGGSAVVLVVEALHSSVGLEEGCFGFGVRAGERVKMGQRLDGM